MGKIVETRKRYKETINEISKTEENWIKFLDSSSWNFKYDFIDQVLIYTQKPEAKACASMDIWNKKLHRWVNKNADVIFVLSKDDNNPYPFDIVFDVTDTHNFKGTEYKLWSVKPEYEEKIIETLEATFGGENHNTLAEQIISSSYNMVMDNIQDYLPTIHANKKGTGLENLTDDEIENSIVVTAWASVAYMMMTRCGINAKEHLSEQEFMLVKKFNSDKIITALGTAIGDIAEMGLKEIAKTVTTLQKEEKNINRTFAENKKQEYSNGIEKIEGGNEYGENRIHENRGLQHTEFSNGEREDSEWQIRQNEIEVPKRKQKSRIFDTIDGERLNQRIDESTRTSNADDKIDNRETSETGRNNGGNESQRSNEMDRTNEQLQDDSRGTSNQRTNIQLDLLLTEDEQKQNIAEVQNTSVFSFTQEEIDNALIIGSGVENGKFRIYEYLTRGLPSNENAEFLKQEYGIGGTSENEDGISKWYDSKGITLTKGFGDNAPTLELTWKQVEKRIRELIGIDRYLSQLQKDEYFDWLDANGIKTANNELEQVIHDADYELAEKLHSYIKDYDIVSYNANFPIENTDEENIELLRADINDESNIKEYIDFLKGSYEDLDYDDEMSVKARALLVELEKRLPYYEFHNGDIVYIGTQEYEIREINEERVVLVDTSFPLLTKEMQRDEFDRKIKENPANDKLRTGKRVQVEKEQNKDSEDNEQEKTKTDTIEPETKQESELKANIKRKHRNKIEYFDLHPEIPLENRNSFKIQNDDLGAGGKKEKYINNVKAIRVLKQCENENRYATPEEQEILSKYVGWGGIQEAFDVRNDNWNAEYNELKSLLTEKEYDEARRSTLTAFYTPPIVIRSIYKALENMGLERGNILEPSCRRSAISLECCQLLYQNVKCMELK